MHLVDVGRHVEHGDQARQEREGSRQRQEIEFLFLLHRLVQALDLSLLLFPDFLRQRRDFSLVFFYLFLQRLDLGILVEGQVDQCTNETAIDQLYHVAKMLKGATPPKKGTKVRRRGGGGGG